MPFHVNLLVHGKHDDLNIKQKHQKQNKEKKRKKKDIRQIFIEGYFPALTSSQKSCSSKEPITKERIQTLKLQQKTSSACTDSFTVDTVRPWPTSS